MDNFTCTVKQTWLNSASATVQAWLQSADLDSPLTPYLPAHTFGSNGCNTHLTQKKLANGGGKDGICNLEEWARPQKGTVCVDMEGQLRTSRTQNRMANTAFKAVWKRLVPEIAAKLLDRPVEKALFPSPLSIRRKRIISKRSNNLHSRPLLKNLSNYSSLISSEVATPVYRAGSLADTPQLTTSFETHSYTKNPVTDRSRRTKPGHYKRLSIPDRPIFPPLVQYHRAEHTPMRQVIRYSLPQEVFPRKGNKQERENRPRVGRSILRSRHSPTPQSHFPRARRT